jgi:DNA repair protein RadA/Sms
MQVRECAKALVVVCKQALGIPVFLVGHVTKGGDIAGPKTLEHIVDTTLLLEGEEGSSRRFLRANKNRFGSTEEVGLFDMTPRGFVPLMDPAVFIKDRLLEAGLNAAACARTAIMEGSHRPVIVEVQVGSKS